MATHFILRFIATHLVSVVIGTTLIAYEIPETSTPPIDTSKVERLSQFSDSLAAIADYTRKGVVFVSVSKTVKGAPLGLIDPFEFFFGPQFRGRRPQNQPPRFKQEGLGSGFFVDLKKGYILTNNHVVEDADEIHVKTATGDSYPGNVVGRDKNTDVAVIQIKDSFSRDGLHELTLANSDDVRVGDLAMAVGAPFGLEASISVGVVSALGRGSLSITELGDFIQTDAAINPGNSGGPLVGSNGQVIGINTAIYSKSGGYNGIGFAIPSNLARMVANELINHGKISRGYLGVLLAPLDNDIKKELKVPTKYKGVLLRSVEPGSPAEKAGLRDGDVVVEADGKVLDNVQHLRNIVGLHKPGSKLNIVFYRDGKRKEAVVTLGEYPDQAQAQEKVEQNFGITVADVSAELRQRYGFKSKNGAVVIAVEPDSSADRAGLAEGDVIVKVNNRTIRSAAQFKALATKKKRLLVRIERQGRYLFVPLK